ncbi:MAG: hemolysin III family protein [Bacteroidales bacterium]|nr:hemolysin III family protein [Bacteroidales bacterium]
MQYTRKFTYREEIANAVSHLVGTLLAIAGLVLMVSYSVNRGNSWHIISTAVFGASMIILYLSSTMTHSLPPGKAKDFFFNFDRIAIYLLIAGTYTPIALVTLHGPLGWVIFGIEWGLALTGIILIALKPGNYDNGVNIIYVLSYAVMGWLILIALVPVIRTLPLMGWLLILIGGFFYTLGILFYKLARFRYHHLVWHLLVIAGTLSHFFAVFFFVIPGK